MALEVIPPQTFLTVHMEKRHWAQLADGRRLTDTQATEIDLVRRLGELGIDLDDYDHTSHGRGFNTLTTWRRK